MNKSYNMNIDTGEKTWLTPPSVLVAYSEQDFARLRNAGFVGAFLRVS